jgi:light-regulated signal transduction histidine kinase (bacteriophytochrome)
MKSAFQRYGLAVFSVSVALVISLVMQRFNFRAEFTAFLLAVAVAAWYAGLGPGLVALVLSSVLFDYFFTEPVYTLYVTASDVPRFFVFLVFLALIIWFSAVRRRVEQHLRQSRDDLEREVTQRRALNQELAKRSGELQATNKELEAFAYSVSHDLRAPIRHIAGFTELLQKNAASVLDERAQRHITMILESAKRMGNLIDDLLAFSRIGRAEAHKTMVSLQQLVQEAQSEVAQEANGRNINWKIGKLPSCYGDRSMLRLVLVNLVSNAVKFTRTRPRAEIEIESTNHNPDQIVISIRDNGVGFDMKYVNKLFGVFQRLHAAEAFEGTGIGLATVQRIVHRHGGRVWAEGLVDGGATFYFSLSKSEGV